MALKRTKISQITLDAALTSITGYGRGSPHPDEEAQSASSLDSASCLSLLNDVNRLRAAYHFGGTICLDKSTLEERQTADIALLRERLPMRFHDLNMSPFDEGLFMVRPGYTSFCRTKCLLGGLAFAAIGLTSEVFRNRELVLGWEGVRRTFPRDVIWFPCSPIRNVHALRRYLVESVLFKLRCEISYPGAWPETLEAARRELRNARRALFEWNIPDGGLIDDPTDINAAEKQLESLVNWLGTRAVPPSSELAATNGSGFSPPLDKRPEPLATGAHQTNGAVREYTDWIGSPEPYPRSRLTT